MRFLLLLALLIPGAAEAASVINCTPKTQLTPSVISGSTLRTAKSDTGRWVAFWCGAVDPADATKWLWRLQSYAVLTEYSPELEASITANGLESYKTLTVVVNLPQIVPPVGSQKEFEWKMLRWSACKALSTKPYDVAGMADLPATFCGAAPVAPPPPVPVVDVYIASANSGQPTRQTFAATQVNGVWKRGAADGTVAVGATLDCNAIQIIELGGLARFCKVPGRNSVTGATLKKP